MLSYILCRMNMNEIKIVTQHSDGYIIYTALEYDRYLSGYFILQ